ncbi:MAG: tetratricopeptide repeat protein [Nitrospirae bacterium]|nr:tetratricopeptide repeat protein [Nitrospirota bacterium]
MYFLVVLTFRTPFLLLRCRNIGRNNLIALFSALLFVSHPIQTEAVTYIFQRLASLVAFFYLLSIVLYIKWRLQVTPSLTLPHQGGGKWWGASLLYLASILSAILAMKTKENAFTLPIVIALYEFFFFRGTLGKRVLHLIPFLLTMLIIPITLIGIDKPVGEIISGIEPATRGYEGISRADYILTQFRVVVTYIRLLFLPVNQNIDYDYPVYHSFFDIQVFLSFLFLIFVFGSAFYFLIRSKFSPVLRFISFGIFWFFITLSVESSVIPQYILINEYRVYLPSMGVFTAIVNGAFLFIERLKGKKTQTAVLAFLILIPLLLSPATYNRNAVWRSTVSLWTDVVRESPLKERGHNNLGNAYMGKGLTDKAIEHFLIVLKLKPNFLEAHNNLGYAYLSKGLIDNAIEQYQIALRLKPDYAEAHYNLGVVYYKKGLLDNAIEQYQIASRLRPDYAKAHYNLGGAYLKKGFIDKARKEFETTLKINLDFEPARKYLMDINKTNSPYPKKQ